jgi:hypothetical protein
MLKIARESLPEVKFYQADITRENIFNKKFKIITAFRFLLNAQPELREQCLGYFYDHLCDDGVLIVNNHLRYASAKGRLIALLQRSGIWQERNYLKDAEFKSIMEKHGFKISKVFSFCLIPGSQSLPPVSDKLQARLEKMFCRFLKLQKYAEQSVYICKKNKNEKIV